LTPSAFVETLRARGGALLLSDDGVKVQLRAPARIVTPRVARYVEKRKPELLALLREREREREAETLLRESYLIASARLGALPVNLPAPLRLPSERAASDVNGFVRGSVERWRHAQAKPDPNAAAYAGATWGQVAETEATDLAFLMDRFAADPRDFDMDILANAHEWFEANATACSIPVALL